MHISIYSLSDSLQAVMSLTLLTSRANPSFFLVGFSHFSSSCYFTFTSGRHFCTRRAENFVDIWVNTTSFWENQVELTAMSLSSRFNPYSMVIIVLTSDFNQRYHKYKKQDKFEHFAFYFEFFFVIDYLIDHVCIFIRS